VRRVRGQRTRNTLVGLGAVIAVLGAVVVMLLLRSGPQPALDASGLPVVAQPADGAAHDGAALAVGSTLSGDGAAPGDPGPLEARHSGPAPAFPTDAARDELTYLYHVLAAEQTLEAVATDLYRDPSRVELLTAANPLVSSPSQTLVVGTTLRAPRSIEVEVQPGETLGVIAQKHLGDARRYAVILEANTGVLPSADDLQVGMRLKVPLLPLATGRTPAPAPTRPAPELPAPEPPAADPPAAEPSAAEPPAPEPPTP
jgi:nucleoid-associated protein YgaU